MLSVKQRIRVEWAHCDPAGIIFNPHYYIWMDAGAYALIKAGGFDIAARALADPLFRGCPLIKSGMTFSSPLYLGEVTELRTRVSRFGNTSFEVEHEFYRGEEEKPVARGEELRVWGSSDPEQGNKLIAVAVPQSRSRFTLQGRVWSM